MSEAVGSISTAYIVNGDFSIIFGGTLFLFTFLAILAGPIPSFISGFIGELLYQIAFYRVIYIDWCVVIALYGFISGYYKYRPLKYHEGMKVYYTFLVLIISSFFTIFLITLFHIISNPLITDFENIIISFGFKFLIESLISSIFIVPILLIIYDRLLASEERHLYYLLLTHHPVSASDHTFYFQFGRTKIYLCSRCSGVIIGGLLAMFFTNVYEIIFETVLSAEIALLVIIIFPIPGLIDWGTQRLLLRKSTTKSRLFTGFIIGVALHFLTFTTKYYFITLAIMVLYFGTLFLLIYFGHKKEAKRLRERTDQLLPKEDKELYVD